VRDLHRTRSCNFQPGGKTAPTLHDARASGRKLYRESLYSKGSQHDETGWTVEIKLGDARKGVQTVTGKKNKTKKHFIGTLSKKRQARIPCIVGGKTCDYIDRRFQEKKKSDGQRLKNIPFSSCFLFSCRNIASLSYDSLLDQSTITWVQRAGRLNRRKNPDHHLPRLPLHQAQIFPTASFAGITNTRFPPT